MPAGKNRQAWLSSHRYSHGSGNPWGYIFAARADSFYLNGRFHSPAGSESLSFARAKESNQRKARPTTPPPSAVPCGARRSGPALKLGPQKTRASDIRAGLPPLHLRSSAAPKGPEVKSQNVAWRVLSPVGDAEKRSDNGSCPGPMFEARRAEFRSRPIGASIAGQSRSDRHLRVAFSWFLLLAKQKKELAPRRGVKPPNSRERQSPRSD